MPKPDKTKQSQFSKSLSALMKKNALTLKDAAKIAGVATSTIQEWKTGSHSPSDIMAAKKLANHLGVSLAMLITGEPDHLNHLSPEEVFSDGGFIFDGYAQVTIKRLIPKK